MKFAIVILTLFSAMLADTTTETRFLTTLATITSCVGGCPKSTDNIHSSSIKRSESLGKSSESSVERRASSTALVVSTTSSATASRVTTSTVAANVTSFEGNAGNFKPMGFVAGAALAGALIL